jgi:hypothetical protein
MNSNNTNHLPKSGSKTGLKSGLQVDRITRIIIEQWPEIWQASTNRQKQLLDHNRSLLLAARDRLQEKAS